MSKAPASVFGQKRKHESDTRTTTPASRKRQKAQDARNISTQPSKAALSAAGELNVAAFVKAREHEINAMDRSMERSRKGLMSRAFQQVPRRMRRRTASHNVKKIPKRLRPRAAKEMKEDNTPTVVSKKRVPTTKVRLRQDVARSIQNWSKKTKTVRQEKRETVARGKAKAKGQPLPLLEPRIPRMKKNTIAKPPLATSKFKRRQVRKAWLPTHLWHAKRSHMTKPSEPLWRMAIPLSPTDKVYRTSHRSSGARGCIAWDMSYISTVSCRGTAAALESLLKAFGFHGEGWRGAKYQRWRRGVRVAHGWASARDDVHDLITAISVFWRVERKADDEVVTDPETAVPPGEMTSVVSKPTDAVLHSTKRKLKSSLMIRCHPSAFHQFWLELLKVAKMQRPQVLVEDLRFEIGTIVITGPESTAALKAVLIPTDGIDTVGKSWTDLPSSANPGALPQNCLFGFNVSDPRLNFSPRPIEPTQSLETAAAELLVSWPPDQSEVTPDIFSHKRRYEATRSLLSQKSINRRKTERPSDIKPEAKESDSKIPLMVYTTRTNASGQSTWTLLAPWKAIDPIWRSLMYCPLPSGGTPRFGGMDETRQIAFEQQAAWFPGDMPGTEAGQVWERTESEKRFDDWFKRPDKNRTAWDKVTLGMDRRGEHGNGWACDWVYLLESDISQQQVTKVEDTGELQKATPSKNRVPKTKPKLRTTRQRKIAKAEAEAQDAGIAARRRNTSSPETDDGIALATSIATIQYSHLTPLNAQALLVQPSTPSSTSSPQRSLFTVRLTYLSRGTPQPCARIYRLPVPPASPSSESTSVAIEIRNLWLTHLQHLTHPSPTSISPSTTQLPPPLHCLPELLRNRHSQPRHQLTHGREYVDDLTHIPPDCPPAVLEATKPVPKPLDWDEKHKGGERVSFEHNDNERRDEAEKTPKVCPGSEDLIGFVTSGAFNLRTGRGTGMGGLWAERVLEGWRGFEKETEAAEDDVMAIDDGNGEVQNSQGPRQKGQKGQKGSTGDKADEEWKEIERHLCIVRNAGESQGRLATWEVWVPAW